MRTSAKVCIGAAASLTLVQIIATAALPQGLALITIGDIAFALMLLALVFAFARNAIPARGRLRIFWMMQATGWSISLVNQFWWMVYDLILKKPLPVLFGGDVLLFLPGVLTLAGFLLRPHIEQSRHIAKLGTLRFLLLMTWWIFFYVFLVSCWQYVSPNEALYNRNYDCLYLAEMVVLSCVMTNFIRQSTGAWRRFYLLYAGAVLFNYLWFALENRAIEHATYFNGCWYDCPYIVSYGCFMFVAIQGRNLQMNREQASQERYSEWMSVLAILAVLSLPVIVLIAVLEHGVSIEIMHFRVLVTALAMFTTASIVLVKQRLLHRELRRANLVLQESSTTDPLTGIRNRRFFSATIQRDVAQSVRAHLEGGESVERDLIFYLIDLDNFKKVNDLHGHDSGDRVLIEAARRISSAIRNSDLLVRWGGEEFLVVSRLADRRQAGILAERVLDSFRSKPFTIGTGEKVQQTCSIGWAAFPWIETDVEAMSHEAVLKFADRGLYRAKKAGKNQAVGMSPESGAGIVAGYESLSDAILRLQQNTPIEEEFTEIPS
jgi:diguanylate cyclase (GGDEF)-like protein